MALGPFRREESTARAAGLLSLMAVSPRRVHSFRSAALRNETIGGAARAPSALKQDAADA